MAVRRENGSGNIFKMSGNRRRPWRARVTVGWTEDGKQIIKNIGFYASRKEAEEMGSEFLFNDPDGQQGTHLTYDKYRGRFNKVMSRLGMEYHYPHETRHTWYTAAKRSHMDDVLRDRMMGHQNESYDVKKLYDHQTMDDMKAAMDSVRFL